MAVYRNSTRGARAIHLTNGGYVLVEPGASHEVEDHKVRRLAPGLVRSKKGALPKPPADLVEKVTGEKPEVSMSMNKADLLAVAEAEGVEVETDDNKSDLIRKIEKARS